MLEMARIECIRTLRQWEDKDISEISRIMEVDWRTAKKYADAEELPVPKQRKRKRPKMDRWKLSETSISITQALNPVEPLL